jgi:hypothetical protein
MISFIKGALKEENQKSTLSENCRSENAENFDFGFFKPKKQNAYFEMTG